jgi:UDP-N-acetylmuramoylalanine--D-glutamate ligase
MIQRAQHLPRWLEEGLESPVAVLGGGVSGLGAKALVESLNGQAAMYDENSSQPFATEFTIEDARRARLVVVSPGFAPDHPWIEAARHADCCVCSELDLGASLWKGPIIAVTGTNGKTTLTSFLDHAFRHSGIESFAVGNIGRSMCEMLSRDCNSEAIAVCEVSSFQAELSTHLQADYVLWTNFAEDHLDRHGSMDAYFRSKYNLISNMRGNSVVLDRTVSNYGKRLGLPMSEAQVLDAANVEDLQRVKGSVFETEPEIESYLMARSLWLSLGMSESSLEEAARFFRKDPHRMELIGSKLGIRFWDDSKATNFHATLSGLTRFEQPVIWIGGGKDKGGSIRSFAKQLVPHLKQAILIGETRFSVKRELESIGFLAHEVGSMEEAVNLVLELGESGDEALLSPGFASFDMFESYAQRGEAFRAAIGLIDSERNVQYG